MPRQPGDLARMAVRGLPVKLARGPNLTVCTLSHDDAAMVAIHRAALRGLR